MIRAIPLQNAGGRYRLDMFSKYRSALARLRSGILPLMIKVGIWYIVDIKARLCKWCNVGSIENEYQFMFECKFYNLEGLEIEIEGERWNDVNINARLYKLCNDGSIENEYQFMFECKFYNLKRTNYVCTNARHTQS